MEWRSFKIVNTQYVMDEFGRIPKLRGKGFLKAFPDKYGYLKYSFTVPGCKNNINHFVHRLVYEVFNGEIPKGMTVDHSDSNKLNNHVSNLKLLTPEENAIKGNARYWVAVDPQGNQYQVYNLSKFCRDFGLNRSHMYEVAKGYKNQTQCKGWKCYEQC